MNKRCSICNHPSRAEIDRGLLNGVPYRPLAAQHGLSPSSLSRHLRHLKQEIALQERQAHQAQHQAALEQLELLSLRLDRLYHHAKDFQSLHVALGCLRESVRLLSLQERFRHSLRDTP
jgi:DNA-binding transcriptional ArsR family regulator